MRIAGGLVLLISALKIMFADPKLPNQEASKPTALQVAISPVTMPIIVPPAGVAAILISVSIASMVRGSGIVIALALLTMMVSDFLIMYFIDQVVRLPGLLLLLQIFGAVLIFIQVALAVDIDPFGQERGIRFRESLKHKQELLKGIRRVAA